MAKGVLLDKAREARSSGYSLGFVAEHENKVDEFYKAAMSAGARDNISPRARLEYYPGYYVADVYERTYRYRSGVRMT